MTEQQITAAWNEQPLPGERADTEAGAAFQGTADRLGALPADRARGTAAVCARQRMGARQERHGCVGESAYSVYRVWDANASEVYRWVKGSTAKMRQTKN